MELREYTLGSMNVAEVQSPEIIISTAEEGIDWVGNLYFEGFGGVIFHQHHLSPSFFELRNGMAGEILQKFSTYDIRLVIVGKWKDFTSKALQDFIRESNRGKQVNFLESVEDALSRLAE